MNSKISHRDRRHQSRSRSPCDHGGSNVKRQSRDRSRSRSPYHKHHHHHHHHQHGSHRHSREHRQNAPATPLPFKQPPLDKRDFDKYEALFAEYLDLQKRIDIHELARDEVKGRWKSFLRKWNENGLAEGWYDPDTKKRADERYESRRRPPVPVTSPRDNNAQPTKREPKLPADADADENAEDDEDSDSFGPSLPPTHSLPKGPTIPNLQDLQHRTELQHTASHLAQQTTHKHDLATQKSHLEALLPPRADPGSRERTREKKAEKTSVLHSFREAKDGGDVEVREADLMGGDEKEGIKAELKKREKVRNEREVRREEILRARMVEREERMRGVREKEERTMSVLREIARQRFG